LGCNCKYINKSEFLKILVVSLDKQQRVSFFCLSSDFFLHKTVAQVSQLPVHQLMASFQRGSTRFYGDIGTVRVAARRDSTLKETNRLVREFDARRRCCVYFPFFLLVSVQAESAGPTGSAVGVPAARDGGVDRQPGHRGQVRTTEDRSGEW
jgi:hypothetical protein